MGRKKAPRPPFLAHVPHFLGKSAKKGTTCTFLGEFWDQKRGSQTGHFLRVARLQNEVGTKDFFEARIFSQKMLRDSPQIFEPCFMGLKKSRKIPAKFPAKAPSPK